MKIMEIYSKSIKLMVVVIDIGIIYFGYVFFMKNDWGKVYISKWVGGSFVFLKVLICLFLKDDFIELYFGYEVEDRYVDFILDESYYNYYFF